MHLEYSHFLKPLGINAYSLEKQEATKRSGAISKVKRKGLVLLIKALMIHYFTQKVDKD